MAEIIDKLSHPSRQRL